VQPWQFRLLAEQLVANGRDGKPLSPGPGGVAADLRTAISRAYYAIFLEATSLLSELGYQVGSSGKAHGVVERALRESAEPELERVASDYGTLGTERRRADYDLENREVEEIQRAEEMLKLSRLARANASNSLGIRLTPCAGSRCRGPR
jgi:uncharacterized protein (UPF0332 family)